MLKYTRQDQQSTKITCKVTDFGFAVEKGPSEQLTQGLGTAPYTAPEIIYREAYDQKVDVWAIGVIAYQLLCDELPFVGKDTKEVIS